MVQKAAFNLTCFMFYLHACLHIILSKYSSTSIYVFNRPLECIVLPQVQFFTIASNIARNNVESKRKEFQLPKSVELPETNNSSKECKEEERSSIYHMLYMLSRDKRQIHKLCCNISFLEASRCLHQVLL